MILLSTKANSGEALNARQNSACLRRRTCSHTVWPHDGSPWQRDNFDVGPGQLRHFLSPCPWQKHRPRCSSGLKNMAKLSKETKQRLQQLFQCGQFVIRWGFIPTVLYLGQYLRRKQWETRCGSRERAVSRSVSIELTSTRYFPASQLLI